MVEKAAPMAPAPRAPTMGSGSGPTAPTPRLLGVSLLHTTRMMSVMMNSATSRRRDGRSAAAALADSSPSARPAAAEGSRWEPASVDVYVAQMGMQGARPPWIIPHKHTCAPFQAAKCSAQN